VAYGDIAKVSYTKPSVNQLRSTEGAFVATMDLSDVKNNINAPGTETSEGGISVYPNPATDYITVKLQESFTTDLTLRITDMTGKVYLVSRLDHDTYIYTVPFKLMSGFYIIQILEKNAVIYAQKLLIWTR